MKKLTSHCLRLFTILTLAALLIGCEQRPTAVPLSTAEGDLAYTYYMLEKSAYERLQLLDAATGTMVPILGTRSASPGPFTWSPDGQSIAFGGPLVRNPKKDSDWGISILNAKGETTAWKPCADSPTWAPDGNYIAYIENCGSPASIRVAQVNGTDERILVQEINNQEDGNSHSITRLSWSPDGQWIAYESQDPAGTWAIWVIAAAGGQPRRRAAGRYPVWSPTGELTLVQDQDIWGIPAFEGMGRKLMSLPFNAKWPTWSPDGQQLALVADSGDTWGSIYLVNQDGSGLQRVTSPNFKENESNNYPAWRP